MMSTIGLKSELHWLKRCGIQKRLRYPLITRVTMNHTTQDFDFQQSHLTIVYAAYSLLFLLVIRLV